MSATTPRLDVAAADRRRQQKAWNWYDWANSAYYTTVLTVMFAPYMITVTSRAAGCAPEVDSCRRTVSLLGLHLAAGSLPSYLTSFATIASALLLPVVGAFVDRSRHKKRHMAAYAWTGSAFAALLFFLRGDNWQLGAVAVVMSSVLAGCSLVSYYAILVDISTEDERDRASSRGWAWGYIGGGLLLLLDLVVFLGHDRFGLSQELAVRVSLLSAAVWWAAFTIIPAVRLRDHPPRNLVPERGSLAHRSFGQLWTTLKQLRAYPMTLTFLLAYLFYNDGIQTVIVSASTYGDKQLGFSTSTLIATILLVQFVAFGGALLFGRLAERLGSRRVILGGLVVWVAVVAVAYVLPAGKV
ncbi:MAG TPA: MFS transporter, partial [Marmoricola sp.]